MGINITKPQLKLKSRLKLSLSLVIHIVFCFQLYVLWTFDTQSWTQYIALGSSILSCGFGTTVGHILLIYGNQRMPMFVDTVSGLICILPHTIMMTGGYTLVSAFGISLSLVIFSVLFLTLFILSALFCDDLFGFVFSIFSSFFSPILFSRHSKSRKGSRLESETSELLEKITKYRKKSQQFYSLNKMILSICFLCCLTSLAVLVNSEESEINEHRFGPFKFHILIKAENSSAIFDCLTNYCYGEKNVSACPCKNPPTSASALCECETLEDHLQQKELMCTALKLSSPKIFNIWYTIITALALFSLVDSALLLSSKFSWSLSYLLLFKRSREEQNMFIRMHNEEEHKKITEDKVELVILDSQLQKETLPQKKSSLLEQLQDKFREKVFEFDHYIEALDQAGGIPDEKTWKKLDEMNEDILKLVLNMNRTDLNYVKENPYVEKEKEQVNVAIIKLRQAKDEVKESDTVHT